MRFIVLTGLSGAGKSQALSFLEDYGFYCVDNMPAALIPDFAKLALSSGEQYENVALVTDIRAGTDISGILAVLEDILSDKSVLQIVYLEASTQCIINRYKETRHKHPLAPDGAGIFEAIETERRQLQEIRGHADYIIDSTYLSTAKLRTYIANLLISNDKNYPIVVSVMSFGFKYSVPKESDLVFDVRFLPNPYYDTNLRPKTGLDEDVRNYVFKSGQADEFMTKLTDLINFLLPCYIAEGKNTLVISVGCTGGKHRSVAIAEALRKWLKENNYFTTIKHRDMLKNT